MELVLVATLGLALLPMLSVLRGRLHSAVYYWVLCGLILWATGIALSLGDEHHSMLVLSHVAGPVSATLFLMGALRFTRRAAPRGLAPFGSAAALLTGLAFATAGRGAAVAVEIAASFPMLAASAWMVNVHAWRSGARIPEKALGVALVALALVMPADILIRMSVEADRFLLPLWGTLSFSIGFLTLASLAERAADRARRLTRELEARTAALDLERRTLLALLESSPMAVGMVDPGGTLRYLNRRAAGLLALEGPQAGQDRPVADFAPGIEARLDDESRSRLQHLTTARDSRDEHRAELRIDEGRLLLDVRSHPVRGERGADLGQLWMGLDVTEERQLDERLAQAHRLETVGSLAGGIAHDFNNQLTAILGNVDLMLLALPEGDSRRRAAEAVERSALHCAELTQGLLSFARTRSVAVTQVPLKPLIEEVCELVRPGLAPGVALDIAIDENAGCALANIDELRRVLMNLAVNARDAVGAKGRIQISARRIGEGDGAKIEIGVRDDGTGMDEATRRQIFDPFFTTKAAGKGSGLGLAISYGIAKTHAAEIEVTSSPGQGTTFRLLWPAGPPEAPKVRSIQGRSPGPEGRNATVLLGEDDAEVRQAVRAMLERAGHRVLEAVDGLDAVKRFGEHRADVDLVLMDLVMPGCSGLEALRQIHRDAPGTPSILMTGNPDPFRDELPDRKQLLLKPFGSRDLMARVQDVLTNSTGASAG